MAYEVFQRTAQRVDQPTLSMIPDGRIALNAASVRLFAHGGVKFVLLLWDKANGRLALKGTSRADKNAYSVSTTRQRSGTLAAKSFFSHIGWNAPKRLPLDASWNEKEKMLEVVLPSQYVGHARKIGQRVVAKDARWLTNTS